MVETVGAQAGAPAGAQGRRASQQEARDAPATWRKKGSNYCRVIHPPAYTPCCRAYVATAPR